MKSTSFINHTFSRTKKMFKSRAATVVAKTDVKMWKIDRWGELIFRNKNVDIFAGWGRVTLPNRINFRKNGLRPPPPHFQKIKLQFFLGKRLKNLYKGPKSAI